MTTVEVEEIEQANKLLSKQEDTKYLKIYDEGVCPIWMNKNKIYFPEHIPSKKEIDTARRDLQNNQKWQEKTSKYCKTLNSFKGETLYRGKPR